MTFLQDQLSLESAITPRSVAAYLSTSGWNLELSSESRQIWQSESEPETQILVPVDKSYLDFEIRMHEALTLLCRMHDWDVQQLATQILGVRSDVMYIRALGTGLDGSIPLVEAQSLLDGANRMLFAAACSAVNPKPSHLGRRPDSASDFVHNDVRMGHTLRGSFVITVLARLPEEKLMPEQRDPRMVPSPPAATAEASIGVPFQRRAMASLALGIEATRDIIDNPAGISLESAVASGLSTNLLRALEDMTSYVDSRALDLTFDWAKVEERSRPGVSTISLEPEIVPELPVLRERLVREAPQPVLRTIYGKVTHLQRGEDDENGQVVIRGSIDDLAGRQVRVELAGRDYSAAVVAHRRRLTVEATGVYTKMGNAYWLLAPVSFERVEF